MMIPAKSRPPVIANDNTAPSPPLFSPSSWRQLLAANPFYLASVVLLLYGIYRISIDPEFAANEVRQVLFCFGSLQTYELLLIGVALLLARRLVWYDATLLIALESLLWVVPFIFVSQAALLHQHWVWLFCGLGVVLTLTRVGSLKRWLPVLNLPPRALLLGGFVLLANAALPIIYRILQEDKVGRKPDFGAAFWMNEWTWWAVLPLLVISANLLPRYRSQGALWIQQRWIPSALMSAWLAATSVHLWALSHVYDFDMRAGLVAPALVALAWTAQRRVLDFYEDRSRVVRRTLLVMPLPLAFLAGCSADLTPLAILLGINTALYVGLAVTQRSSVWPRRLALLSLLLAAASLPGVWRTPVLLRFQMHFGYTDALLLYALITSLLSARVRLGLLGTSAIALLVWRQIQPPELAGHWALALGLAYALLHSLAWNEHHDPDSRIWRRTVATLWVLHALVWAAWHEPGLPLALIGLSVVTIGCAANLLSREWHHRLVPVAGCLVAVSGLLPPAARGFWAMPPGALAVLFAFLFFAVGTAVALTKHRWHESQ